MDGQDDDKPGLGSGSKFLGYRRGMLTIKIEGGKAERKAEKERNARLYVAARRGSVFGGRFYSNFLSFLHDGRLLFRNGAFVPGVARGHLPSERQD